MENNKEQQADLNQQKAEGDAIQEMIATRGWKEYLYPKLYKRLVSLRVKFQNANELKDFITCQQAINAIENLFNFIDASIALGEQAAEILEKQKNNARQEIVEGG
ncbi:MAG: hypothetical protein HWN68_15025 [Desulfobacterales bacterium]|nr:hypothetical protein [Desulfobacterales bacterium]